ncbi:MAG: tetratricopeptide repeat protein [Terriglobales bacterium]
MRPLPLALSPILAFALLAGSARAGDLHINIPKRTKPTPVQKLNQEGVNAIKKHKYDEARKLFYRAYLLDPDDPFTLNNLGYISELSGDVDRAQRFYELAAENTSDATIDKSTDEDQQGKSVAQVAGKTDDKKMQINRYNVQALGLLMKDRAPEADLVLQKALALDTRNPFTLNNLGYAKEKEGELEEALNYYSKAAAANSDDPIIVTANKTWRGRGISQVASNNVDKLRKLMAKSETAQSRVARLNLEGVSAMNRNDRSAARKYFTQAYKLSPNDPFTLNNMGYVSEMDGDRETADFYYEKAAEARGGRNTRVTVATRREVEGRPIAQVAAFGDNQIEARMEVEREARMREGGPVILRRRDNSVVVEPDKAPEPLKDVQPINIRDEYRAPEPAPPPKPAAPPRPKPNPSLGPLPGSIGGPPGAGLAEPAENPGNVMQPLPDTQQPPAAQIKTGDVLEPLPDTQQPSNTPPPRPPL